MIRLRCLLLCVAFCIFSGARASNDIDSNYPISYLMTNLIKYNSRPVQQKTPDYIETSTANSPGTIKIIHSGAFMMQCSVSWEEVYYDKTGAKVIKKVGWNQNWNSLYAPFQDTIALPGYAQEIRVFARVGRWTGWPWEWKHTVIEKEGIPLVEKRTFMFWGTTYDPHYYITPSV